MKSHLQLSANQKGVMLLEALLGILIFSIGILAVVGMQTVAVRTVSESKYRMDASFLANEVIGQMWGNRTNLALYDYNGGVPNAVLTKWVTKVTATLPGAAANPPNIDIGAGGIVTVVVFWQHPEEAGLASPPPPHSYRVVASITCC